MKVRLFVIYNCPHCQRAREIVEEENIKVEIVDIAQDKKLTKDLLDLAGKMQVPCLDIDGKTLFDSKAIEVWLEENLDKLRQIDSLQSPQTVLLSLMVLWLCSRVSNFYRAKVNLIIGEENDKRTKTSNY